MCAACGASGGVPRSPADGGAEARRRPAGVGHAHARRAPARELRAPEHPLAYGYPGRTVVFRQNFPLYDTPRRWLRMAYCTSCLDGPEDARSVVLEWGDRGGAPLVVSGQAWGEGGLVGRPAVLDLPAGKGHVVGLQLQPPAPRPEPRRPPPGLERHPQLARDPRGATMTFYRWLAALAMTGIAWPAFGQYCGQWDANNSGCWQQQRDEEDKRRRDAEESRK